MANQMICTLDWQLDWSSLRHSTFTTKHPGNKLAEVARLYSRENDFYQLLQCGGWHNLLPLAVVLWGCVSGLLCVWLFFAVPRQVDGSGLS